jgi:hypothetical protein
MRKRFYGDDDDRHKHLHPARPPRANVCAGFQILTSPGPSWGPIVLRPTDGRTARRTVRHFNSHQAVLFGDEHRQLRRPCNEHGPCLAQQPLVKQMQFEGACRRIPPMRVSAALLIAQKPRLSSDPRGAFGLGIERLIRQDQRSRLRIRQIGAAAEKCADPLPPWCQRRARVENTGRPDCLFPQTLRLDAERERLRSVAGLEGLAREGDGAS